MDLAENLASCTYNQGGTCAIFGQLNDINGILRQVKLELRETSPGTLSLTQAPHLRLSQDFMSGQNPEAWHLLDAVLQQHLCVISICIDERQELTGIPFDIITRKVPSLVMLRLRAVAVGDQGLVSLARALPSGHRLQNLRLEAVFLNADCVLLLCSYLFKTATLETFSLARTHICHSVADRLFNALQKSLTIRTLQLSLCLCYRGDYKGHGTQLAACLGINCKLHTLILERCCFDCVPGLQVILETLRYARQLVTLYLIGFNNTKVFAEVMPLIIFDNKVLRNLNVVPAEGGGQLCQCYLRYRCQSCKVECIKNDTGSITSLASTIPNNQNIQLMTIDLSNSSTKECQNFFEAVRWNSTLRKVTVLGLLSEDALSICKMIRECGITHRIHFKCQLNVHDPVEAVITCRNFSSIRINAVHPENSELLSKSLTLLPFWTHTTELSLSLSFDGLVSTHRLFVRYLERATKLRSLQLLMNEPITNVAVRGIVRAALFSSKSIRKLHVDRALVTNVEDAHVLAGELSANKTLYEFTLFCDNESPLIDELLRILSYTLEANTTLCWIHHTEVLYTPHYNVVQNLLRRNRAMSMCAAHFVIGTKQTQRCADAFRRVYNTPGLLAYVMETASIGEIDAAFAIRAALSKKAEEDRSFFLN